MYTITKEESKTKKKILKINDIHIESKINPEKEAERIIEREALDHHTHIIFGYGAGYLSEKLLQKIKNKEIEGGQILIVDPILEEVKNDMISCQPYSYSMENMHVLENVMDFYLGITNNRVKLICTNHYSDLFPNEFKELLQILQKRMQNYLNKMYTISSTALQWQKNIIRNVVNLSKDGTLYDLQLNTNIPAVVVSGGPSLSKQLNLLKKYQDQVITVVSGSTINSVLEANIEPDFVVSVDGRLSHYQSHYKQLKDINTSLIYSMETHYKIRGSFSKKGFAFFTHESQGLKDYVTKSLNIAMLGLNMGTSCANFAFTVASLITKGPIAFIGQDLAFTNNTTHASTNKDYHELTEEEITKNQYFYVEGYNGDEVLTSLTMNSMKESFEKQIEMVDQPKRVFNCTEGGAKIQGMQQMPFESFLLKNTNRKEIILKKELLARARRVSNSKISSEVLLKKEIVIYNEISKLIKEQSIELESQDDMDYLIDKNRKLEEFIDEINVLLLKVPAWKVIEVVNSQVHEMFLSKRNEDEIDKQLRIYEKNKELIQAYSKVVKALCEYSENILNEENIND